MSKTKNELIEIEGLIAAADVEHDVPVAIDAATGEHTAGFKVVDANSSRYKDGLRAFDLNAVKTASARRKAIDAKTDEGAGALLDIGDAKKLALVKSCVVSLYGFKFGGKPAEPTDEVLSALFKKYPTWVDKIADKINEVSGFLVISATS